jgi:hypothetical protein
MDLVPVLADILLRHRGLFAVQNEASMENQTKKHLGARFFYLYDILSLGKDRLLLINLPLRLERIPMGKSPCQELQKPTDDFARLPEVFCVHQPVAAHVHLRGRRLRVPIQGNP